MVIISDFNTKKTTKKTILISEVDIIFISQNKVSADTGWKIY